MTFAVRIEEELAKLIDEVSKEEGMDRSIVIRRFLMQAAKEYLIEKSLAEYQRGRGHPLASRPAMQHVNLGDDGRSKEKGNPCSLQFRGIERRLERLAEGRIDGQRVSNVALISLADRKRNAF